MTDPTFYRDPLDRADGQPDWGDYIPFDGDPLPTQADPNYPPSALEIEAAEMFDFAFDTTGDFFLAWRVMTWWLAFQEAHRHTDKLDRLPVPTWEWENS